MRTTERIRRPAFVEPLRNLPITLVALFIVMAAVDVLLVMQPSLVRSLRDDWQSWVHGSISAPWATLVGAVATVGGLAIAAATLTLAVRGIVEAPYLWLASALVAGCCFSISSLPVDLPVRMPTPAFAGMSALLLFGGGAFFQSRATLFNMTGLFLTSTPLALLGVGYLRARTSTGARYTVDDNAQIVLGLLLLASVGTILISIAARRLRAIGGAAALATPTGEQLAELLERARSSEQRAAEAEYQLEHVLRQAGGAPRLMEDDEYMGRRRSRGWFRWLLISFLLIGGGAAYFTAYLPLEQQLVSQRKFNHEQTRKHASELAALRADVEREREELKAQLAAAAQPVAPAKPEKKKAAAATAPAAPAEAKPAPSEKPAPAAKPAPASAAPPAPEEKPAPAKAAAVEKPAPATKPAAVAKPAAPPKPAKVAPTPLDRMSTSDDPLEGLDGM